MSLLITPLHNIAATSNVLKGDSLGNAVASNVQVTSAYDVGLLASLADGPVVLSVENTSVGTGGLGLASESIIGITAAATRAQIRAIAALGDPAGIAVGSDCEFTNTGRIVLTPIGSTVFSNDGGTTERARIGAGLMVGTTTDPGAGNATFSGSVTTTNPLLLFPSSAMSANAIDVTLKKQTKSISANTTFTLSATPTPGQSFGLDITTDSTARVVTLPAGTWKSVERSGATVTTITISPSSTVPIFVEYEGSSVYRLYGEPLTTNDLGTATVATGDFIYGYDTSAATDAKFAAPIIGTDVQAYDADLATIAALADPNADRLLFWDDSAGSYAYLAAGSGLTISGTTITSGGVPGGTDTQVQFNDSSAFGGDSGLTFNKTSNVLTVTGGVDASAGASLLGPLYTSDSKRLNQALSVYAAGTAYSMTNSDALLDFGTTDPSLTIDSVGTYLIFGRAYLKYNAATYAGTQTVTVHLRRTNNTAADIANGTTTATMRIITTLTDSIGIMPLPPIIYTTTNTNDAIALYGSVSAAPAAGSVDVVEASIVAIRLY